MQNNKKTKTKKTKTKKTKTKKTKTKKTKTKKTKTKKTKTKKTKTKKTRTKKLISRSCKMMGGKKVFEKILDSEALDDKINYFVKLDTNNEEEEDKYQHIGKFIGSDLSDDGLINRKFSVNGNKPPWDVKVIDTTTPLYKLVDDGKTTEGQMYDYDERGRKKYIADNLPIYNDNYSSFIDLVPGEPYKEIEKGILLPTGKLNKLHGTNEMELWRIIKNKNTGEYFKQSLDDHSDIRKKINSYLMKEENKIWGEKKKDNLKKKT